jgi:hypothetical protein
VLHRPRPRSSALNSCSSHRERSHALPWLYASGGGPRTHRSPPHSLYRRYHHQYQTYKRLPITSFPSPLLSSTPSYLWHVVVDASNRRILSLIQAISCHSDQTTQHSQCIRCLYTLTSRGECVRSERADTGTRLSGLAFISPVANCPTFRAFRRGRMSYTLHTFVLTQRV